MENILVSSCLCGINCKYNGKNNYTPLIEEIKKYFNVIEVCPETLGGLPTPRDPSEINGNKVISNKGKDVTINYNQGALKTLELAKKYNAKIAILKDRSPSCGRYSYDGTFTHNLIDREGITYRLLSENGIKIYTENEIEILLKKMN